MFISKKEKYDILAKLDRRGEEMRCVGRIFRRIVGAENITLTSASGLDDVEQLVANTVKGMRRDIQAIMDYLRVERVTFPQQDIPATTIMVKKKKRQIKEA